MGGWHTYRQYSDQSRAGTWRAHQKRSLPRLDPHSPGTNELVDVHACCLEGSTRQHAHGANPDGGATTNAIGEVGGEGVAGEGTNVLVGEGV